MDESALTHAFNSAANPEQKPIFTQSKLGLSVSDFDLDVFMGDFDDFDMTEDEKREVLHALFEIMCRFVEIGFGLDSHSIALKDRQACESIDKETPANSANLLSLEEMKEGQT